MKRVNVGTILVLLILLFTVSLDTKAYAAQDLSATPGLYPTVSEQGWVAYQLNGAATLTPEQYIQLMAMDPTFNLKAYMYYNDDLMSQYTYDYWKYYKHFLDKGIAEKRVHFFQPDDSFNTVTIGRYTTKYNPRESRARNIELAASLINGTIVLPGGSFSYNDTVGPRTADRGFKMGHMFKGEEIIDGIGGGICQVSTTLYDAMMIAGIPATERHVHSLPVAYVRPNLDATVCWKSIDLRFINPYDYPIAIFAQTTPDGVVTVTINKFN